MYYCNERLTDFKHYMHNTTNLQTKLDAKPITDSEKQTILDILHRSFIDNKSVNYTVKQDAKRSSRIYKLLEYSLFQGENYGKIYLSKDQTACAIVLFPSKKKTTIKGIAWDLNLVLKCIGIRNVFKVLKREAQLKKQHPSFPFLHLWYVGVSPENQGKGLGTKLVQEIIEDAQNLNLPIFLETSTERNFPFYEKLGFQQFAEIDQMNSKLRMYLKN